MAIPHSLQESAQVSIVQMMLPLSQLTHPIPRSIENIGIAVVYGIRLIINVYAVVSLAYTQQNIIFQCQVLCPGQCVPGPVYSGVL